VIAARMLSSTSPARNEESREGRLVLSRLAERGWSVTVINSPAAILVAVENISID